MKKIYSAVLLLLSILVYAQATVHKKFDINALTKAQLKNLIVETDKFTGYTFIKRKGAGMNSTQVYIAVKDGDAFLRVRNYYRGSEWIFFEKMIFLVNGERKEYAVDAKREIVRAGVEEISDIPVTQDILDILNSFKNSKENIDYRFAGSKGNWDHSLKIRYNYYLTDVLDVFNSLDSY